MLRSVLIFLRKPTAASNEKVQNDGELGRVQEEGVVAHFQALFWHLRD